MPNASQAIVSSNADPNSLFNGVNINQLIGAETFYRNGYWGTNAIITNVEAGFVWDGHDTLGKVGAFISDPSLNQNPPQYDFHATMVGEVLAGQLPHISVTIAPGVTLTLNAPDTYWVTGTLGDGRGFNAASLTGIAPSATLWSAAIATSWNFDPNHTQELVGSFNISDQSLAYAYTTAMQTGVGGRTADVINSSWGDSSSHDGSSSFTQVIDALAYSTHKTVVFAAGNEAGPTGEPAAGFNRISVAATASDTSTPVYGTVAPFSNHGPIPFYNPKTGQTIANARAGIDIAAPGDNLTLAMYAGMTGGHDPLYPGTSDPTNGSGGYFFGDVGGTSFAAPIVAGGAALVVDVGRSRFASNPHAIDGRVIKAVLLNSATKNADWNNGQSSVGGVISTAQALDYSVGTGMLNLDRAYSQFTAGTHDLPNQSGGNVSSIGWAFGHVSAGDPNDYFFAELLHPGKFTATLTWFADRQLDATGLAASDVKLSNLDLELWRIDGTTQQLVAESVAPYDTVQHLYVDILADAHYMLRVSYASTVFDMMGDSPAAEDYGLAWMAVPEPTTFAIFLVGSFLVAIATFRRSLLA